MVYDGATGALVNMYSFPSNDRVGLPGYDVNTGELYVPVVPDTLVAIHYDVQTIGNVNATLVDAGCGAP